ncbi:MAG: hypothetical protein J0I95_05790 [Microbacterium sp.]|uniref:hypothetical protein n=1 Tax=unclassified Microbacterium TaxID=2609290 RepID=UPI001ACDCAC0|nr:MULTISPECIES: hypothetical protein [unclassified Microbacterium]MBN9211009.1 hypothetical protein [Microbacterium sp.]
MWPAPQARCCLLETLRRKFAEDGADLRRWMIVVCGYVALVMSAAAFTVAPMSV